MPLTTAVKVSEEIVPNCSKTAGCAGGTCTSSKETGVLKCSSQQMLPCKKEKTNFLHVVVEASDRT